MNWFKNTVRTPWLMMSHNVITVIGDDGVNVSAGFLTAIGLNPSSKASAPFKIEAREVETRMVEMRLATLPPNQFVLARLRGTILAKLHRSADVDHIDLEEDPGLILNGGQIRFLTALMGNLSCDIALRLIPYNGSVGHMLSAKLDRIVQRLPFSFSRRVRRIWESEASDPGSASSRPASEFENSYLNALGGVASDERTVTAGIPMSSSYEGTLVPLQEGGSVVGFAIQDPVFRGVSTVNPNSTWSTATLTFSADAAPVNESQDLPDDRNGTEDGQTHPATPEAAAEQVKPPSDSINDAVENISQKKLASDEDIDNLSDDSGPAPYA